MSRVVFRAKSSLELEIALPRTFKSPVVYILIAPDQDFVSAECV